VRGSDRQDVGGELYPSTTLQTGSFISFYSILLKNIKDWHMLVILSSQGG